MMSRFSTVFSTVVEILGGETERRGPRRCRVTGSGPGDCSTPAPADRAPRSVFRTLGETNDARRFDAVDWAQISLEVRPAVPGVLRERSWLKGSVLISRIPGAGRRRTVSASVWQQRTGASCSSAAARRVASGSPSPTRARRRRRAAGTDRPRRPLAEPSRSRFRRQRT